jgi:cell wall-associated NlpC family hydrolase
MTNTSCTQTRAEQPIGGDAATRRTGPRAGWRRGIVSSLAAALTATTGLLALGGTADAEALPTNALAPQVVTMANEAIAALDEFAMTGDPVDFLDYKEDRTETARLAAQQLGYGEVDMIRAWNSTPLDHQRAVLAAMSQVGVAYRTHTSEEGVGFDCSGLTTYAWAKAGVELFRQSGTQINEAAPLDRSTAKAGDLVYYPGHVMLYLGVGDAIIHSVQRGRTVEIDTISERRTGSVRFGDPAV